jgi:LysM repeat protein
MIQKKHILLEKGDTLWGLAREYNTTVDKLKELNSKMDSDKLQIGQSLRVE